MNNERKNRKIITISLIAVTVGIMVMLGWLINVPALQSIVPGFDGMRFNTALCFVLFGAALLITQFQSTKYNSSIFLILAFTGTFIGLTTLLEDLFHFNSGLDQLFVTDKTGPSYSIPFPGRMAFNASMSFTLLGIGFLGLQFKKHSVTVISQLLFNLVALVSGVALVGYLYGVSLFRVLLFKTSMAAHTAILFFIVAVAATLLNPSTGFIRLFTGKQVGNQMAKRLFTLMILMIVIFAAIKMQTQRFQLFSSLDIGICLLAIGFLLVSFALIWDTANWLNRIDQQRSTAEDHVKLVNIELEKRVEERSSELFKLLVEFQKSEEKYRSLIEHASDAIYVLDTAQNFTDVNAAMCQMMGYTRDELLAIKVQEIIDPEELKTDPLYKNMSPAHKSVVRERRFKKKNGQMFTVEINVKMFADDRILVIARDVTSRKKMETELRDAELKFRTIADKSMVGVYIVQDGKFTYVNPRFAEVFGYEPAELTNTVPIEAVFHESYRAIATENVRQRMAGEVDSVHYEAIGRKKDGSPNWVEFYGSRAIIGTKPTIIGSMIDVTERKKADEELRSSEQKYKLLFDSNPLPMWMVAKDDLSIIAVNEAAANHYGYTQQELLQMSVRQLRYPDDLNTQDDDYKADVGIPDDNRIVRHVKKDGTLMYMQLSVHDIIFEGRSVRLSLTNDVTEKLKAQESLQKSEANLQTILKTTDTAYALFDLDLKVQAYNPKAIQFTKERYGHAPEKGDQIVDFFPHDRLSQFIALAKRVLQGNNINYEVDYPQQDGSVVWYYVRLFPITDEKKILGLMMALYDITERKNAEQDLKSAYSRIQSHIDSIKNMAWKQSHLIRSPLANLKGLTEMLKDDPSDIEIFDHILNELNRMDTIIIEMAEEASYHD